MFTQYYLHRDCRRAKGWELEGFLHHSQVTAQFTLLGCQVQMLRTTTSTAGSSHARLA